LDVPRRPRAADASAFPDDAVPRSMSSRAALERELSAVAGFADPSASLEQYATPADLAAHVVHVADLSGDVAGRTVLDLGAGTGTFALGAALRGADRAVGLELDADALAVARRNERRLDPPTPVDWLRADATRPPVSPDGPATVLMNPPFGAQRGTEGADRAFLRSAAEVATVSYSVHNEGSRAFVESFVADAGGEVTAAFRGLLTVGRQFDFHEDDSRDLPVEVFRVVW
jgi:putative methylase